jgi:hypothetical protein
MRLLPPIVAAAALLALAPQLPASPIIREADAIYFSDFDAPPLKLKVLQPAPAYFDFDGTRYVGTLRFPQTVEVQAISDRAYRIRGNAQQGQILGWVATGYLEEIPEKTLTALRESDERRQIVTALIAASEVAIGMTPDEVTLSIGDPQKRTTKTTADGVKQIWEFVEYANIPQQTNVVGPNGVVTIATTYIKTPVGRLTVSFQDNVVDSLDQSEGTILTGNQTTVVAPPILVY